MKNIKQNSLVTLSICIWATAGAADLTPSGDTYIRNSVPTSNFGAVDNMVANLASANVRMAIVSFDISSVPPGTIASAKLQLQDVIGSTTKSYQIWGLLDAHETFNESTLTWSTAGFLSGTTINLTKAYGGAALGTFNNVQNSVNTLFDVTSGNFLNFLNASGDNDVTFVIVDTDSVASGSGWATKEHATALKPTLTLVAGGPPVVSAIQDDRAGGPVAQDSLVTYTVTFSGDIDATTVAADDFGNAGSASITIGVVTEISPRVFTVEVTPTSSPGTLQFKINQGAVISGTTGGNVVTSTTITDDTTLTVEVPDNVDPTLAPGDIADNKSGGPVIQGSVVTYTLTFSEDMDDTTVAAGDFGNEGSATFTIGTVTETSPGVFSVPVTPTSTGTLRLQINQNAVLSDPAGNNLNTSAALLDDTTIVVEADNVDPTLATGDIQDDQGGGPVTQGTTVTYTLSFSEDIDHNTVDAGDFGNAGTAAFTIGNITEVSPGVFEVEITPNSAGTLQLKVLSGAGITDAAGNLLDTSGDIVSATLITVQAGFSPAGVKLLRVVFVAGQSNADGRAATSELPTSPVNLQLPQNDVDFFRRVENTIHPLTTLRPGLSETGGFGPAITCGRYLADELADGITTRIAIIKYANGGTNLHTQWAGGGDGTSTGDGSQYVRFQQTVTAGLVALSSTYPNAAIELLGMVWLQGESDDGAESVNYQTNLTNFIADVRLTYGADLRFIVIRLSNGQTAVGSLATIRAAQTAVAAADPLTGLVNSDGFGMKTDKLHFNGLGQQQNGEESAIQLLNLYPFLSPLQLGPVGGGNLDLTVNDAFEGFVYTLRSSDTLQAGDWDLEEAKTAAGDTVEFTVTPSGPKRFYRVERTLAP